MRLLNDLLALVGAALIVVGSGLCDTRAGIIVGGALVLALGLALAWAEARTPGDRA